MKKKFLKEMLTLFQNSSSEFIVPSGMSDGFMTDSESAHYAILETLHMLGLVDLVSVEETVEYGILHYRFHFNVEEDMEEIRAEENGKYPRRSGYSWTTMRSTPFTFPATQIWKLRNIS